MAKRTCSVDGCDRASRCLGWCGLHYQRWTRHGDPLLRVRPAIRRFNDSYEVAANGCWQWTARTNAVGYGQFSENNSDQRAHRWAYEHFVGPIPEGLELDHLCRNKGCVNPAHLEPVTRLENIRRSLPYRQWRTATHCRNGHEFTPENTYLMPSRGRITQVCRACRRARDIERYRRRAKGVSS